MYFKFFKRQYWDKRSVEDRRRNCAVLPQFSASAGAAKSLPVRGGFSVSKKPRRVSRPQARKTCGSFFPAACTSGKIHSGLQVCRLSAFGGQLVRAAGRGLLSKNSRGVFRQPLPAVRRRAYCGFLSAPGGSSGASRRRVGMNIHVFYSSCTFGKHVSVFSCFPLVRLF